MRISRDVMRVSEQQVRQIDISVFSDYSVKFTARRALRRTSMESRDVPLNGVDAVSALHIDVALPAYVLSKKALAIGASFGLALALWLGAVFFDVRLSVSAIVLTLLPAAMIFALKSRN